MVERISRNYKITKVSLFCVKHNFDYVLEKPNPVWLEFPSYVFVRCEGEIRNS